MPPVRRWFAAIALVLALIAPAARAQFDDVPPEVDRELRFLQGLRERGYFDLALEYVNGLLARDSIPEALRGALRYELGRGRLEEATATADLDRRQALLEQARQELDGFVKAYPEHRLTSEALVQLARLNVERGHTALLQANEVKTTDEEGKEIAAGKAEREAKLAAARAAFGEARKAYDEAEGRLQAAYDAFPKFIPDGDPRRAARDRAHTALMDDQLQRAVVDYEEAQTYAPGSKERDALLDEASGRFKGLYERYRTQLAGLHARMLQAKSLEEKGELGPAMGYYNELMEHTDPRIRDLQRQVGYFRIIVINKRKEHALAVDEAARWLQANPQHRTTEEGLGVQLEMAKAILAQLEGMAESERDQAIRAAADRLTEVVRYYSPHKPEALALLQKYQARSARRANQVANLSYDDAMSQADTAISTHDWALAETLLKQAIRRAERSREPEKVNRARYYLAYVYYASDRHYEAAALADHLARRYPSGGLSAKAAEIALASLTQAYNTFTQVDRQSDLDRMIDLATYTAQAWPDSAEADSARSTLGEIHLGRGQYAEAASVLESVREGSPSYLSARVKAGDAHWRLSQRLRDEGKAAEADAEAKKAEEIVAAALQARDQAGAAMTDPARITNANALAEILRATGRPAEAIALLEPIAAAMQGATPSAEAVPLHAGSLSILLRAHLAAGQPDRAIEIMKTLESVAPSRAALTQLYFELGRSLQAELDRLEKANNPGAYRKTQDAYRQFLTALAGSQAGQSYDSLQWAGESMLGLRMPKEAGEVFERVLNTVAREKPFTDRPDAATRILRTRLKLVAALRDQGQLDRAATLVQQLVDENPRMLEALIEKGLVLEAQARGGSDRLAWEKSLRYWKDLALRLGQARQKRPESYEAWLHVANALEGLGQKTEAVKTLKGVMTLTPSVGSPEMKARYEQALERLGG
jgi:hypothetical protein